MKYIKSTDDIALRLMGILQEVDSIECSGTECNQCFLGKSLPIGYDISICESITLANNRLIKEAKKCLTQ